MRRLMLGLGATALLVGGAFGCAHRAEYYGDRAEQHHEQAKIDASHGDFLHALHNEHKAAKDDAEERDDY